MQDDQRARLRTHAERMASRDGYFAPKSVIRRVMSSPLVSLLGAGPAALFQVAHPLVAASVVAQPDYHTRLWTRWLNTVQALYLIVYGSREEADSAGEAVRAVHERVQGVTERRLGQFPRGTPFAASEPALMLWVHGALFEVTLAVYSRFVRRLTRREERSFYDEMMIVGQIVGMPPATVPATLAEFREYLNAELAGPVVGVTEPAREIAEVVFRAPLPLAVRPLVPAHRLATAGLLPPGLRAEYGLSWGPARSAALTVAAISLRVAAMPIVFAAERISPTMLAPLAALGPHPSVAPHGRVG